MPDAATTPENPVIVVGAGPVGMTAALLLRARDIPVRILERDPESRNREGSRAIYIHGATLKTLEKARTGLGQKLVDGGLVWPTRRTLYRGKTVFSRTYDNPGGDGKLPHFTSLPQVEIEKYMFEACQQADVEFVWEAEVEAIDVDDNGVTVTAGGQKYSAPYVIGADGGRSSVRKLIGNKFEGARSEDNYLIADVDTDPDDKRPIARDFHYEHPAVEGRNVLIVPFQGGWRVDMQCKPDDDPDQLTQPEVVADWVAKVMGESYRNRVTWISNYKFLQVVANEFVDEKRRVLLVGEAAHLFAPFGARGMNSGVADADAAVDAVAEALRNPARAKEAVDEFNRKRKDAAEWNRAAAGQALEHLRARELSTRVKRRLAAAIAPVYEPAGAWLDEAPYGPRKQTPTGSKY